MLNQARWTDGRDLSPQSPKWEKKIIPKGDQFSIITRLESEFTRITVNTECVKAVLQIIGIREKATPIFSFKRTQERQGTIPAVFLCRSEQYAVRRLIFVWNRPNQEFPSAHFNSP
jgi:hypothetical protein